MVAVIAILVTSIVVLFTSLLIKLEQKRRKYDQFGGPKSLPIVGNVHQMKRSPRGLQLFIYLNTSISFYKKYICGHYNEALNLHCELEIVRSSRWRRLCQKA